MAESIWHYALNDQTYGPIPHSALRELAARGTVQRSTLVWSEGMAEWTPAQNIASLWINLPASPAPGSEYLGYQTQPVRELNYAGFWMRFVAYIIDWIVTIIVGAIVGGIAGAVIGVVMAASHTDHAAITNSARAVGQILGTLAGWLYYALMESSPQQATLGKMALGLYVTDLSGGRLSFGRATGRFFGKYLSVLTLTIGFMMAGWTVRKQALHDMLAGALVLRR